MYHSNFFELLKHFRMVFGLGKKKEKKKAPAPPAPSRTSTGPPPAAVQDKFDFKFDCQLAHGGPTCIVRDFRNIKELYIKMAEAVKVDPNKILFVTVNTSKVSSARKRFLKDLFKF